MVVLVALLVSAAPCRDKVTEVVVLTAPHRMVLCNRGSAEAEYQVDLGSGGIGKQKRGDAKTPLGVYPLAAPRHSDSFHTFIYVGYPTVDQRKQGFTGSDIGIHGPWRGGPAALRTDWTLGCIAVGTDAEIDAVAAWVKRVGCGVIRLE